MKKSNGGDSQSTRCIQSKVRGKKQTNWTEQQPEEADPDGQRNVGTEKSSWFALSLTFD